MWTQPQAQGATCLSPLVSSSWSMSCCTTACSDTFSSTWLQKNILWLFAFWPSTTKEKASKHKHNTTQASHLHLAGFLARRSLACGRSIHIYFVVTGKNQWWWLPLLLCSWHIVNGHCTIVTAVSGNNQSIDNKINWLVRFIFVYVSVIYNIQLFSLFFSVLFPLI